jgi:Uma2 family endonuclease
MTLTAGSGIELPEAEKLQEEEDTGVRPFQWTVEQYYRAIESGLFEHPERLELIRGEIIEKMAAQETPHAQATGYVYDRAVEIFGPMNHVRSQSPLNIGKKTEPEPDVMVVRGKRRDYDRRKPTPADVLFVVEVSDTTLGYDRNSKAALYAEAGVAEYWVLNLKGRWLEVRREPIEMPDSRYGFGYRTTIRYTEQDTVAPLAADAMILVSDLLPASTEKDA